MKNFNKFLSFIVLTLAVFSFATVSHQHGKEKVFAASFSNPTTQLRMVGHNGYQPSDYFDSLSFARALAPSNKYYNHLGQETDSYNIIAANNNNFLNEKSTGSLSFKPFNDYIALANQNVLYAYAQAGIVSGTGAKNDITISISQNQTTQSKSNIGKGATNSSGVFSPSYFKTNSILVKPDKDIVFQFSNNEAASLWSGADFKLFEPSIFFLTAINQVTFANTSKTVYVNHIEKLQASNAVLDISQTGSLISYFKQLHKIEYEIVEGQDKAQVIGNYIYFTGNTSGQVKVRAKALMQSDKSNFVYSDTVTYNLIAEKKDITVFQNFENAANIEGAGSYYLNQPATLIANINQGYEFSHWVHNGSVVSTPTLHFTVLETNHIELFAKKHVNISKINIKDRQYDGTTKADIESVVIDGLLPTHQAEVKNLQASYFTSSAGTKIVSVNGLATLEGKDAQWYILSQNLPTTTGNITQKNIVITINSAVKTYGQEDPAFQYQVDGLIEGDELNASILRQPGEDVGNYEIIAEISNANYVASIVPATLTIEKKQVNLSSLHFEKYYNKTKSEIFVSDLLGAQFSDVVGAKLTVDFLNENVQVKQPITIKQIEITGSKAHNYYIVLENLNLTGSILPKQLLVEISSQTKVYGQPDGSFSYSIQGVLEGDVLNETVTRAVGENVGSYDMHLNIENSNYEVNIQNQPKLNITKKTLTVKALQTSKAYGDQDPEILYQADGLLETDKLLGALSRVSGENVGTYNIVLGTLKNDNYLLSLETNSFEIRKRLLIANISFESKIYDGTKNTAQYSYTFLNTVFNDAVTLSLDAEYSQADAGESVRVVIKSFEINNQNYQFVPQTYFAEIKPRNLQIFALETVKMYGDEDPEILYNHENLVEGDTIYGSLSRVLGENIGSYQIQQGTLNAQNNPNYNITLFNNYTFVISKRNINVTTISQEKQFSEQDPEISFKLYSEQDKLAFNHTLKDFVSGNVSRVPGETPGRYSFTTGSVISLNNNYTVTYIPSGFLSITKANLNVSAVSVSKVYGEIDPVFMFETNREVFEGFEFNLTRQQGESVGNYKITYLSLYHEFYNITYQEGFMSILPRQISLKPAEQTKFYGEQDPQVSYSIVSGILVNGDTLETILTGRTQRVFGESVGTYQICVGDLEVVENYTLEFVKTNLTILKQEIEVVAQNKQKQFGQEDEPLSFNISKGFLAFEDEFFGSLQRVQGEEIGIYNINQGTLSLNENYTLTFVSGKFEITKAKILVTVDNIFKTYGNQDPEITYTISGNYISTHQLNGSIFRKSGEEVGEYEFVSTLNNNHYEIAYNLGTFKIDKRIIEIKANSYTITYGQPIPQLEYTIVSGTILSQDTLNGSIYKVGGNGAGRYDINSTLNLGRNYQIEFTKGFVTILPINIKVVSDGASKVYGQADPLIPYSIFEGNLLGDDVLTGKVARVQGEDIGVYRLVSGFTNPNYNVDVISGKFEILPKDVNLYIIVEDKVFDDSNLATIKRIDSVGIIDGNVSLHYNKNSSAKFQQKEVGNNIKIDFSNMFLIGEKSFNYNLQIPEVFANITYNLLSTSNIKVYAQNNTQLVQGTSLSVSKFETPQILELKNKNIISTYKINLLQQNQELKLQEEIKISVDLKSSNYQNVKVYMIDENNNALLISSTFNNGNLTFSTNQLGNIVIVSDSLVWLDILTILSIGFLAFVAGMFVVKKVKTFKRKKTQL